MEDWGRFSGGETIGVASQYRGTGGQTATFNRGRNRELGSALDR
jgi:hypothetical protein